MSAKPKPKVVHHKATIRFLEMVPPRPFFGVELARGVTPGGIDYSLAGGPGAVVTLTIGRRQFQLARDSLVEAIHEATRQPDERS
jgi:hypothetical protein